MNHAIILAAGQSQRMRSSGDKLLTKVAGFPVLYYAIAALNDHDLIDSITIVVNKINRTEITKIIKEYKFKKAHIVVLGGLTRQESLTKGMYAIATKFKPKKTDLIVVHNGANPLVSYHEITEAIEMAETFGACIVGHKIESTVKKVHNKSITETIDRNDLFAAQTPQVINFEILKKALKNADKTNLKATDEAMLVEALGQEVKMIPAHENNFKITTHEDLERLKSLLGENDKNFRVGIGQDSHEFERTERMKSKGLTLAGINFPNEPKLKANSDGDVILHAIFNAISQAFGGESLGFYADDMCEKKGITDSKKYLEVMLKKMEKENFEIGNVGLMIECKTPKIDPIAKRLKESLSKILTLDPKQIGITSTSGENLTSFGLGLGIQCFAIISLFQKNAKPHAKVQRKSKPRS